MRTIKSLTSGRTIREVSELRKQQKTAYLDPEPEVDQVLNTISSAMTKKTMCERILESVNIATAFRDDVDKMEETRRQATVLSEDRHSKVSPEELARKWNIGLDTAKKTLQVTTQAGIRQAVHPLHRRHRVDHLALNRRRLHGRWFTDTLKSKVTSLNGNKYAEVYTNGKFTKVYPMAKRSQVGKTLTDMADDVGIPDNLTCDLAPELVGRHTEFMKEANRLKVRVRSSEAGRKNQNYAAESEIGTLKKRWRLRMNKKTVPKRLWDFGLVYESELLSRMARGPDGRTGYEEVTGNTGDISEWLDFEFYDLVWWYDASVKYDVTDQGRQLARWLGASHRIGSDLCHWLVTESGKIIAKTTVQHVVRQDYLDPKVKEQIDEFNRKLTERLDDANFMVEDADEYESLYLDDEEGENTGVTTGTIPTDEEYGDMSLDEERPEEDDEQAYDKYVGAELIMDLGSGAERKGTVVKRAKGLDGQPIGRAHSNPVQDTRQYEVEFTDGSREKYQANIIAENMFAQSDEEGNRYVLMQEIMDHKSDGTALHGDDGYTMTRSGQKRMKTTTRGWFFLILWKDGSSSWEKLADLKASNPVELAEYAVANRLTAEPAFAWWAPYALRRRNRIISKLKTRYWRTSHKFGIRLPHSIDEALAIDKENGNDFWEKAINKEMKRVKISWKIHEEHAPEQVRDGKAETLIGFQEIGCHLVFDVKMDFTRKARFVAEGYRAEAPASMIYSSVAQKDSVRIAFLLAALNDVPLLSCDVMNAYLNAPCLEKIWFVGGRETGDGFGKVCILTRALHGLRSSGRAWRTEFAKALDSVGFQSTKADPDVWIRAARKTNGDQYYEMTIVYVDDVLVLSTEAAQVIKDISDRYDLKEGSVKEPEIYLGANIEKVQLPDGREVWAQSPRQHMKNAVKVCEDLLKEDGTGETLKSTVKNPSPSGYKPELDITRELDEAMASRCQQLIGILRWAVELGRIDIAHEVAIMSQHQALSREGHLNAVYHIFAYLKHHLNGGRIVFDDAEPKVDESAFQPKQDWTDMYGDVEEELPPKYPEPLGKPVKMFAFVDANHAGNVVTRRSHTGILIFLQNAPIIWYSKRQNTAESATFGSEFVALRTAKDLIVALRYKLRMFGVPIDGPASVFCDNQGVVKNTSLPESTLAKKHNSINYHAVREAVAAGILRVGKEDGMTNLSDLLTKVLNSERRKELCQYIMQ